MSKLHKLANKIAKAKIKISKNITLKLGITSDARKDHHKDNNTERK